jgi:hypothetical protein
VHPLPSAARIGQQGWVWRLVIVVVRAVWWEGLASGEWVAKTAISLSVLRKGCFAGLVLVILIGLWVESLGFHTLERLTVRGLGVQR